MITLVDTHAHLHDPAFSRDVEAVVERARQAGVVAIISCGTDNETNSAAVSLAERFDIVYAAVGLHPYDAHTLTPATLTEIRRWGRHPKVVAIGEIGLDYHTTYPPRLVQREALIRVLEVAAELGLPISVHDRQAHEDILELVVEWAAHCGLARPGVLHCFSGDESLARAATAVGLAVSFAGPITFKNALSTRRVAAMVDDHYLLIETDSPYLAPMPQRGKRNEPAYVGLINSCLAEVRGVSAVDCARLTTQTAYTVFTRLDHEQVRWEDDH